MFVRICSILNIVMALNSASIIGRGPEHGMQRLTHPCSNALASAMLVMVAFGTAPGAAFSQDAMGSAVRDTGSAARARVEQRARMEQSRAHAQMPDTMYASTPDPSPPPHPFPLEVTLKSAPERAATSAKASSKSASGRSHRIPLFPAALRWAQKGYQGFARIINRSETDGEVRIEAFDDAGMVHGPVMLRIGAGKTVHFNSDDLEGGNAGKGLSGGVGVGTDDWRLKLSSGLDIEVLSYIRTTDGFLTAMHDEVPASETGHRVATFNPGGNVNQVSRLRLINPGTKAARVSIEGIGDEGEASDGEVVVALAPGSARTLGAEQLEAGRGLNGALGDGTGKWRLEVSANQPIEVMSLLSSPTGHLTNLSTVPAPGETAAEVFTERISGPIVQGKCIVCHIPGGLAEVTRLHFVGASNAGHEALNLGVFKNFVSEVDDGATLILNKIQGVAHGGGVQVAAGTPRVRRHGAVPGVAGCGGGECAADAADAVRHGEDGAGAEGAAPCCADIRGADTHRGRVRGGGARGGCVAGDDTRADDGARVSRVPDSGEQ